MARKYPNYFTPDGVDIETAFANDDLEFKDILAQIANVGAINLSGEKRQSVLSAHVDASGNPDYITATGLNVSIDGSTTPVILAFAAGFDDKGSVDLVDAIKTSVSAWTVPSNSTVYLYVDKDASTGLLSYGYSTLPDLYQKAAPTAVLDQHWYDVNACKTRRYNGSAWEVKQRVFVGKVVAGASTAAVTIYPIGSRCPLQIANLNVSGAINETQAADVSSAATVDLGSLTGNFANITGTTAITSLGTASAGVKRSVKFTGILTLTYNATSLILPGAANITTAAGDTAEFVSLGSGNWQCMRYTRADGKSVISSDLSLFVKTTDFSNNQLLSSFGYQKLPGGLIIQWGTTSEIAFPAVPRVSSAQNTIFPMAFPAACLNVSLTIVSHPGSYDEDIIALLRTKEASSFTWIPNDASSNNGMLASMSWTAIGY